MTARRATIDDLYRVEGKAELIGGRIVRFMPSGYAPSRIAFRIARLIDDHSQQTGVSIALADGVGFSVPELASGRESFSPYAAYYKGPLPINEMRFIEGPPTFAVEVRSQNDYGEAAEAELEGKRTDYFEAGALVVWDVDPLAGAIAVYKADAPTTPTAYHRGDTADAEPAVPGWRVAVNLIFG